MFVVDDADKNDERAHDELERDVVRAAVHCEHRIERSDAQHRGEGQSVSRRVGQVVREHVERR